MKSKIGMIAFLVLGLSLFFANPIQAIPTVRLEMPFLVNPGQTFTMDVFADGVTDVDIFLGPDFVLAFGFDVVFPSAFTYNGASVWPGLLDGITYFNDSTLFPDTDVAGSTLPTPFIFGDDEIFGDNILLATLSFTSSIPGNFSLGIFSDILDPNEGLITLLNPPIDMTDSKDITVTPEPGTLLLVGSGLVGLALRRKFQRNKTQPL